MPGQAYYKKSAYTADIKKKTLAHPRPESCSSIYSLYDEEDVPPEIENILSMSRAQRYPHLPVHAAKTGIPRFAKESKIIDVTAQQKTENPKVEPSQPRIVRNLDPNHGKQIVVTEELAEITPVPLKADKFVEKHKGKNQLTLNTTGHGSQNILPTAQTAMGSVYSEMHIFQPLITMGRQVDTPPSATIFKFTNEKSIAVNTAMRNHGLYAGALQMLGLAKVEPAQPNIEFARPTPMITQSVIKYTRQSTLTTMPAINTDIGNSYAAPYVGPSTVSFTTQQNPESSTPALFIRGMSQPFPCSKTLGGYPQYPYNKKYNPFIDGSAGAPVPVTCPQLEHIERFTPEGDMAIRATKSYRDGEGPLEGNSSYFHDVKVDMKPDYMSPARRGKEKEKKARKKAISKSMISAPIGPVAKDERRVVSEIVITKDSPAKGRFGRRR